MAGGRALSFDAKEAEGHETSGQPQSLEYRLKFRMMMRAHLDDAYEKNTQSKRKLAIIRKHDKRIDNFDPYRVNDIGGFLRKSHRHLLAALNQMPSEEEKISYETLGNSAVKLDSNKAV